MRPLVPVLLVLLLAMPASARITSFDLRYEAEEDGRSDLEAEGQRNCVNEALVREATFACPREATHVKPGTGPPVATRLLEAWHATFIGVYSDGNTGHASFGLGGYGSNTHRNFGIADLIPPGASRFFAWSGLWDDLDEDGILDLNETYVATGPRYDPGPLHEWVRSPASVVGFIEPGSRPGFMSAAPAEEGTPDVRFVDRGFSYPHHEQEPGPGPVVFLDGSLVHAITMTTVSDALLAPDGGTPYTLRSNARVDVDRYVAVAPTFVGELYGLTVGPVLAPYASPTLGTVRFELPPLGGTGLEGIAGPAYATVYAPYPVEHEPGSMSSAEGRHDAFLERYAGWIDLLPRSSYSESSSVFQATAYTVRAGVSGAAIGRGQNGGQAVLPGGLLHFELRVGMWMDRDGDRYVGSVHPGDPYEQGTRPSPDRYDNAGGEFFGAVARLPNLGPKERLVATLTPHEAWGDAGVRFIGRADGESRDARDGGATPVRLVLGIDPRSPGLYTSHTLFFPEGTLHGGFTVCIEPVEIVYSDGASEIRETLFDCDDFERL